MMKLIIIFFSTLTKFAAAVVVLKSQLKGNDYDIIIVSVFNSGDANVYQFDIVYWSSDIFFLLGRGASGINNADTKRL